MIKLISILFSCIVVLAGFTPLFLNAAEDINTHIDRGNRYLVNNQPFMAVNEFRQAIAKGSDDPVLYRNLAVVLYDLGFIDEAIIEMKKALALTQDSNFLKRELGIMYLSKDKYAMALEQFVSILQSNPGFSEAYYYLGEIYYKTKQYDMAWLAAKMAIRLGHTGNDLAERLSAKAEVPQHMPWSDPGEEIYIRQILVELKTKADEISARLHQGDLFENIAGEFDETIDADLGGFKGSFSPNELHPRITRALTEREPLSEPVMVETEKGYHIVQRLLPFSEEKWKELLAGRSSPRIVTANKLLRLPPHSMSTVEAPLKDSKKGDEKVPSTVQTGESPSLIVNMPVSSPGKEPQALPDTEPPQEVQQQTASAPETEPEKERVPEPVTTPVIRKKPETAPVEEKAVLSQPSQNMYYVHVGTFREKQNAESLLNDLKKLGYPAYSYIMETKRGNFHKVVAGEYTALADAKKTGEELKKKWIDFYITRKK